MSLYEKDADFIELLDAVVSRLIDAQSANADRLVAAIEKGLQAAPGTSRAPRGSKPEGDVGKIPDGAKKLVGAVEQVFGPNKQGWTSVKVNGFKLDTKLPPLVDAIHYFNETGGVAEWHFTESQNGNFTNRRLEAVRPIGEGGGPLPPQAPSADADTDDTPY